MPQLATAQTGPHDVNDAEGGKNEKGDPPSANDSAAVRNQLSILLHAQNKASRPEDEPRADNNAAKDRCLADANETGSEALGSGDAAAGVEKVAEAKKIEDWDNRKNGERDR